MKLLEYIERKLRNFSLRQINHILTIVLMILLGIHVVVGIFLLSDISFLILEEIARYEFILVTLHAFIGGYLTLKNHPFSSKKYYIKDNKQYWMRRITGVFILLLSFLHIGMFVSYDENEVPSMNKLTSFNLLLNLLFLIVILIHIVMNIKPMLISLGVKNYSKVVTIIQSITWTLTILALISSVIYYLR